MAVLRLRPHQLLSRRIFAHDLALDVLERGYEAGAFGIVASIAGPPVNELRSQPRFVALAQKVGLAIDE